ncbi:MAG: sulfur carrier protein ThiS [Acidobacteriota bacterium]|nr:sulfur carrier protein ThiS [Acidobacteriota bacterium]
MTITINGEQRETPEGLTLKGLLEWLKVPEDRVAVECNLQIIPRAEWAHAPVAAGDRIEVVHFVGGGCPAGALSGKG